MKITKKNVARLASISAAGAGALGVAAGTAEAATIQYGPYPLSTTVGYPNPLAGSGSLGIGNLTVGSLFKIRWYSFLSSANNTWKIVAGSGTPNLRFAQTLATQGLSHWAGAGVADLLIASRFLRRESTLTGSGPSTTGTPASPGSLVKHYGLVTTGTGGTEKTFGGSNDFLLFRFLNPTDSHVDYGWLQLNNVMVNSGLNSGPSGDLVNWSYYDTTSNVPEPSTLATGAFAALLLGAAGVRRWRAARKPSS